MLVDCLDVAVDDVADAPASAMTVPMTWGLRQERGEQHHEEQVNLLEAGRVGLMPDIGHSRIVTGLPSAFPLANVREATENWPCVGSPRQPL